MLTSNPSNQYLRPDYLQPLPTTLDAKNSPLALLAQTCSAIGAETPNPKLLANMEKSAKSMSKESRDKTSPLNTQLTIQPIEGPPKSSFKPYEMVSHHHQQEERAASAHRIKTPTTNGRDSNRSATSSPSQSGRQRTPLSAPPTTSLTQTPPDKNPSASPHNRASSKDTSSPSMMTTNSNTNNNNNNNYVPVSLSIANLSRSEPSQKPLAISPPSSSSSSSTPSSSSYFSGFTSPALPPPYALELMAQHMKAVTLNPYLNYARQMKAPGAESMMSVCRDPYCQGCALSPAAQMKGPCPAGCMQCDHHNPHHAGKVAAAAAAAAYPQQMAAAYAQAQLAAFAAASQLPYICNWIGGGGGVESSYCGKRFGTSDELLQHLRTHTASMAADPMMNPHLFQRTYPTPPLSPLSSARYHPYSKPSFMPSMGGLPPPPPHLAQYFSPYSLYASRLGTPPTMPP